MDLNRPSVLLVDDHPDDIGWVFDLLEKRGYNVDTATNEEAAKGLLKAVKSEQKNYALAIVDVMVSVKDIMDLVELTDDYFELSRQTGVRLCRYAREELGIGPDKLPIVCISARDSDEVRTPLRALGVPLYNRMAPSREESIREYIRENLPEIASE